MNLGTFTEHVKLVFEYGQQVMELLTTDDKFRKAYARVTTARNQVFLDQLEHERELQNQKLAEAREQGIRSPIEMRIGRVPTPVNSPVQRSSEEIEARKSMLRDRLARNKDQRRIAEGSRFHADLRSQAKTFFLAGEQAEQRGQLVRALNHFKLCAEYLPEEVEYSKAVRRVENALKEQEASEIWSKAEMQTESEDELQQQAAVDLYLRACQLNATPRRLVVLTQQVLEYDRAEDALEVVHQGVEDEPHNLDLKWCLVQCYEARKDLNRALQYVDEIISYDPSEPRALRFQKRYR